MGHKHDPERRLFRGRFGRARLAIYRLWRIGHGKNCSERHECTQTGRLLRNRLIKNKSKRLACLRRVFVTAPALEAKNARVHWGVTTRRSRKLPKRASVAGIPPKAKTELFHRLRRALETAREARETPERTRERYVEAIDSVATTWQTSGDMDRTL